MSNVSYLNNPAAGNATIEAPADEVVSSAENRMLPYAFARRHDVLVSDNQPAESVANESVNSIEVYCTDDISTQVVMELQRYLRSPLRFTIVEPARFNELLQAAYERTSTEAMHIMDDLGDEFDLSQMMQVLNEPEDLLESEDDAPIIRLINALLAEAIKENASDIHIEPYEEHLVVRFRIDGVLREILQPSMVLAPLLVSRIKVMARLDIAEKRLPQDGRISLRIAGRAVDVRVSTLPTGSGERVVMRLLDKQAGRLDLEQLGMSETSLDIMGKIIHRPHGIILVTGPTGSGKTTSLYAAVARLNDSQRNIMTVEDPIEYDMSGISQTAVNNKVDMSFARGLRAILRQDPDVVMVGEIRDLETAQIAVQASLTGHLVLSTLHTNTAVGAITRLRDMGVETFLLSSSLLGVAAQRLVRVLCLNCKQPYEATVSDCEVLGASATTPPTLYRAAGCKECSQTGYRGRTGIYEVFEVDDTIKGMIHDASSEHAMEEYLRKLSPSLRDDGLKRVLKGDTSMDEVLRVSREN